MSRKIFVTGFLTTLSPLHVTSPSSARFLPESGEIVKYGDQGVPCTTVQRINIPVMVMPRKKAAQETDVSVADQVTDGVDTSVDQSFFSTVRGVPVFTGNNANGRLRDFIGDEYLSAMQEHGQKVKTTTYSAIMCGAATGSPDGAPISYQEYKDASKHPQLGLMGGGPRMIERRARIHNSFALCRDTADLLHLVATNRIPYDEIYGGAWQAILVKHKADLDTRDLTQVWGYRRNDDLRDLKNVALAEATIKDFVQAYNERQGKIIEEFTKGKGEASKTSVFTYQGLEFVLPMVSFPFVAILDNVTDEQAGLWLRGFERFVREARLGGWSRNGFGEFAFADGRIAVYEDGEMLFNDPYNPGEFGQSGAADEDTFRFTAVCAWLAAAKEQKGVDIDFLMRLPAVKEKKEKTK